MPTYLDNHYYVPTLNYLPGAFSSNGSVLSAADICFSLTEEFQAHSGSNEFSSNFPPGGEAYLCKVLKDVLSYVQYECETVHSRHTGPLLRSVYGWNVLWGVWQSQVLREVVLAGRESSTIHSLDACVEALSAVLDFLSHCVDITESMRLPMAITSKLFACMSVLLTIPISESEAAPLGSFLHTSPQVRALEAWCERINDGCKLWPSGTISWRRNGAAVVEQRQSWWEWLGGAEPTEFVAEKSHNMIFLMSSFAVLFVYLATKSE